ncbi:ABC transporter ATP-binding protein [Sporosarcina sp. BI001-red]|uniref:ABC transporter ATP-binding protein n=1 Tax=Sporosarcina sp. BI001-red TaxID=2282866 RepID=UPI000E2279CC|nr:ABC transporter ATP-binding protein [Sporosarcina sp. BI001-red]REB07296.1 ABC transporter ATP-binding protein [Sporosarcina sp. BI001-red]
MIELNHVTKSFHTKTDAKPILKDLSLTIPLGSYIAITGPSGSGKSTLLNLLGGLETVDAGEIYVDGDPIHLMCDDDLAELRSYKIGYIFQNFQLLSTATALENVMMPLLPMTPSQEVEENAKHALMQVGLQDRLSHLPSMLSGGEQQRVAIARAMSIQPRVLLADEPTGNLDSETGQIIIGLLEQLHHKNGTTLIIVTHDPQLAARANAIIRVLDGKVQIIEDTNTR